MKIKAALIDLDDTITDTRKLYNEALAECYKLFVNYTRKNIGYDAFLTLYDKAREETIMLTTSEAAQHNRALYFQKIVENLADKTDFELVYQLYKTYYSYIYDNMRLFPEAYTLLNWLKENHKSIILVSNGNAHIRIEKMHALGLDTFIDYMVSSEEVGTGKPSAQPFLVALNKAKLLPNEVVMIGNSAGTDIYGANRIGITTIQTYMTDIPENKPKDAKQMPKYAVRNLREVIEIIRYLDGDLR